MSYVTAVAESRPAIKADKTYQRCIEAANCYNRMIYTSSLIYNDSVKRFNNTLKQKHFAPLAGLLGFAPREYLQFAPDAPVVCSAQPPRPRKKRPPEIVPAVSPQKQKQVPHSFQKTAFLMEMCALAFFISFGLSAAVPADRQNAPSIHAAYGKQLLIYS